MVIESWNNLNISGHVTCKELAQKTWDAIIIEEIKDSRFELQCQENLHKHRL